MQQEKLAQHRLKVYCYIIGHTRLVTRFPFVALILLLTLPSLISCIIHIYCIKVESIAYIYECQYASIFKADSPFVSSSTGPRNLCCLLWGRFLLI